MTPIYSIVVTTRNDDHGGDLVARTRCFMEGIYYQCRKFSLPVELIVVEWNPPQNSPLLKDVLPPPPPDSPVVVRYIVVPKYIHDKYFFSNKLGLFQMIAKNVGIRRAKGKFVLCTNIDLLFSDELFAFLKENHIQENAFYRANRFDIKKEILLEKGFEAQLRFAKSNILQRLGKNSGYEYLTNFPSFFFGFKRTAFLLNAIIRLLFRMYLGKTRFTMFELDTFACGDFTLMSKNDWLRIEGYPELDLYSIHVDSMALIAAAAVGMKQVILPEKMCSYHIFHENGWESFLNNPVGRVKFTEERPGLDWSVVWSAGLHLIKHKTTWGLNKPDWGYANEKFKEYIFEPGKPMLETN
ncbi:MAG: hypothetical protein RMJ53_02415 [Chitinophagales bacterium]|nr:hypothetical protein [Chitinophagales bacterium]MDW8273064.1 hypothetical protein [Chitinophagales bacterium]